MKLRGSARGKQVPLLVVTGEDAVNGLLGQFLRQQADKYDDREAANHGDGTAVDGVDGVAQQHVDDRKADTPHEAGPDGDAGDTTPVESQHERSQEGSCQCTPRDTHELSDERGGIEGDEQRDDDEEHDEHAHDNDLTALNLLRHDVVDGTLFNLTRQRLLVAIDKVEGHRRTGGEHQ